MGCDGGTIPKRDELVRTKRKPEEKDKNADLVAKWKHCAISQEPLRPPMMACELGRLYNKESALEFLLDRSKFECASSFEHLRGLKDLKELNLTENTNYNHPKSEKGDAYIDTNDSKYICPVVGLEMNGKYKFCFLWSCGCVLSERALREVKTGVCHKCGKKFVVDDIITINGMEEEVEELRTRMKEKRSRAKLDKKAKKAQKRKPETSETDGPSTSKLSKSEVDCQPGRKLINGVHDSLSNLKTERWSKVPNGKGPEERKGKTGSVQNDPSCSTVYKSLFTSCDAAKNQQKAHWITYNPLYN
ncbi:hypothetical protein ACJMK2_040677 [Sinanodonta woodiana]|uniref:Replication termination factor 2 n=1 Tax=Sinanodonta woodiana TaxID=1069815 RepID=A0ABD3W1S6_SINWO